MNKILESSERGAITLSFSVIVKALFIQSHPFLKQAQQIRL